MKQSAGLFLYRRRPPHVEVLLVHPGAPFWASKDKHAWSMPKGEYRLDEDALAAARREFAEKTGYVPEGPTVDLGTVKSSGKVIHAWAIAGEWDPAALRSNTFEMVPIRCADAPVTRSAPHSNPSWNAILCILE